MDTQRLFPLVLAIGIGIGVLIAICVWGGSAYVSGTATATAIAQTTQTAQAKAEATLASHAATATAQAAVTATLVAKAQATEAANANVIATVQAERTATNQARTATASVVNARATTAAQARQTATAWANATATVRAQFAQATATSQAQWHLVLSDSFDKDSGIWTTGGFNTAEGFLKQTIADGKYRWDLKETDDILRWVFPRSDSLDDFSMTVDARQLDGSDDADFGLLFRKDGNGNYYYFVINNQGEYHMSVKYNLQWATIIPWTRSPAIRAGDANRLTVIAEGARLTFFINGQYVGQADDNRVKKGSVALVVAIGKGQQAAFEFDNFELRAPAKSAALATNTPTVQIASAPGCSAVQTLPDEGAAHVFPGQTPTWNQDPPTSGVHNPEWLVAGIYVSTQDFTKLVHSLEHGYIVIYYRDLKQDELTRLTNLVRADNYKIIVNPYAQAPARVTLTAWNHRQQCNGIDEQTIKQFIAQFRDQGPEIGAP